MDPKEMRIDTPVANEGQDPAGTPPEGAPEGETKPEVNTLTEKQTPEKQDTTPEGEGDKPKEGEGTDRATDQTPSHEQRINDLMSKWQKEQAAHSKTKDTAAELIEILKGRIGATGPKENLPAFMKEGWEPKNYQDLQNALLEAKDWGKREVADELTRKETVKAEASEQIDKFVNFIKAEDPEFDEQSFYEYADKHKFPMNNVEDLMGIYTSFAELRETIKQTQDETKKNIQGRQTDKVGKPGAGGSETPLMTNKEIHEATGVLEVAQEALRRAKGQ